MLVQVARMMAPATSHLRTRDRTLGPAWGEQSASQQKTAANYARGRAAAVIGIGVLVSGTGGGALAKADPVVAVNAVVVATV